jgi:hypothetical protein
MIVFRTLYVGNNPPGVDEEKLLEFMEKYLTEKQDFYEAICTGYYGVISFHLCPTPQYIESYEKFASEMLSYPISSEIYYTTVKAHFHTQGKRIRDMRFGLNH